MPTRSELIASGRDAVQIAEAIGADAVFYQELDELIEDIRACNPAITSFDASCFDGKYITGGVTAEYLAGIETSRANSEARGAADSGSDVGNESGASSYQLDLGLSTVE